MAEIIKLTGVENPEINYELLQLVEQLEHKDNVLKKEDGYTGTIILANISEITVVNGQITGVKE